MADTTPYSAFVSLNGFVIVLRNERLVVGERDGIAPPSSMEARIEVLRRAGTEGEYHKYLSCGLEWRLR